MEPLPDSTLGRSTEPSGDFCFCVDHVLMSGGTTWGGARMVRSEECVFEERTARSCVLGIDLYNQTLTGGGIEAVDK